MKNTEVTGRSNFTGAALVATLSVLVLVVILILGFFNIVKTERVSANGNFESLRAKTFANIGADNAVALIREATEAGSAQGKFWASQPGKITVFNADGTVDDASSRFLYPTNATGGTVNLNQAGFSGVPPIATAASVKTGSDPSMEVNWVSVVENPLSPATSTNRMVGRYAFWVDDETAKLNLNTADGTAKYSTTSFGSGTPTEVSLTALKVGGTWLPTTVAQALASRSGARYDSSITPRPFNEASESLQVPGVSSTFAQENSFNITHYNRSPELNIFGEPRINLITTTTDANGTTLDATLGDLFSNTDNSRTLLNGLPLTSVYPQSSQLPLFKAPGVSRALPQYFMGEHAGNVLKTTGDYYAMGMRIARYLKGFDSQGNQIKWPLFSGADSSGFAGKYTDRQIDSIALQILTLLQKGTFADQFRGYAIPYVMPKGFLSGKLVCGLGLAPRANEILVKIETLDGSPPRVKINIVIEWYLPREFGGNLPATAVSQWNYGLPYNSSYGNVLNAADSPRRTADNHIVAGGSSPLGGYWMDNLMTIYDQDGDSAGIDFCGNDPSLPDPDSVRSAKYHPSAGGKGTGPQSGRVWPIFEMRGLSQTSWNAGEYHTSRNYGYDRLYPMKEGTRSITLGGGLTIGAHNESGSSLTGFNINPVPLDSYRGPYTGESLGDSAVRAAVLEAVIPFPKVTIPVPGAVTIHMQVADPMVNSFPGDWVVTVDPPNSEITMQIPSTDLPCSYTDGQNTLAKPDTIGNGDPQSFWWPPQNLLAPKSQRFPSVGFLQYLRTGIMPSKANESMPLSQQKGNPYQMLNFAPSSDASQKTAGGTSYPDWAMLDLFTVPASLQPMAASLPTPIHWTWGGATSGRLNANTVPLPFSSVSRLTPLQSILKGISVSTSYDAAGDPVFSTVDESAISAAVNQYVSTLGRPLMMPSEICNVPEVAAYLYQGVASEARSRNDLVRQIVGNFTTCSNTFSIWTIGQVIKKAPRNTKYGIYETGDAVIGESRKQILVERILDYGPDGVPGTGDDPSMSYHSLPYKFRVIEVREVTN
ncbi:MAG: hypothetical protein ACFUZC_02730 [Chthoniobacteraceae bacterium]